MASSTNMIPLTYDILVKALRPLEGDLMNKYELKLDMLLINGHPRINHILNTMESYLHEICVADQTSSINNIDLHYTMINSYYIAIRNIIIAGQWSASENEELQQILRRTLNNIQKTF